MGLNFKDDKGKIIPQQGITNMGKTEIEQPLPASTYEDIINRLTAENTKLKEKIELLKKMI